MRKIIFVCDSLRIGGIQRSLVNLLNKIDFEKYEVDLFLFNDSGEYKQHLSPNVNIIKSNKITTILGMTSEESKLIGKKIYFFRKIISLLCFIFGSSIIYSFLFIFEPSLKGYDVAISFSNNLNDRSIYFGCNKFVLEKIQAKRKIAWVHVDVEKISLNNKVNLDEYNKFDLIVNVSKSAKKGFDKQFPQYAFKSKFVYNIIPSDEIKHKAQEFNPFIDNDTFNLVTVCRLDKNKAVLKALKVAVLLKKDRINFFWTIIGDGPEFNLLQNFIIENNLIEYVKLEGYRSNPYPYIYNAHLLVSTSKTESFGLSIAEAIIINTPVVATNYPALSEIVINGINGLIVSRDEKDIYNTLKTIILDKNFYSSLKKGTKQSNINNKYSIQLFYDLLDRS